VAQVLIHGADFYDDLFDAFGAIESHDWRTAGADLGKVMNQLSNWTTHHACTSDYCYVVLGIFQYVGDVQGDIRQCEGDFKHAFSNFTAAFHALHDTSKGLHVGGFHFNTDVSHIKEGIKDIGYGLIDVSHGVKDCQLQALADIIEQLAIKLGVAPEVQWVEELLTILIKGVEIEQEVGEACVDYSDGNWVGFGYNIAKLVKTLVGVTATEALERPALAAN